jgi:hypothetical protein
MQIWKILIVPVLLVINGCSSIEGQYLGGLVTITDMEKEKLPTKNYDGTINFAWKDMLPTYMHYNSDFDYEAHVEKYMSAFHREEYRKVKNDEFELNKAKKKYMQEMRAQAQSYDPASTYIARVPVYFGEYDFDKQRFPLVKHGSGKPSESKIQDMVISTELATAAGFLVTNTQPYPSRFNVSFVTPGVNSLPLSHIPMAEDVANRLIKSRKRQDGYVNREAIAKVSFQILGQDYLRGENAFRAMITDVLYEL